MTISVAAPAGTGSTAGASVQQEQPVGEGVAQSPADAQQSPAGVAAPASREAGLSAIPGATPGAIPAPIPTRSGSPAVISGRANARMRMRQVTGCRRLRVVSQTVTPFED